MAISIREKIINRNLFFFEGEGNYLFKELFEIIKSYVIEKNLGLVVLKADITQNTVLKNFKSQLDDKLIPYTVVNNKFIWIDNKNITAVFDYTDFGSSLDLGVFLRDPSIIKMVHKENFFDRITAFLKSQHSKNIELANLFGSYDILLSTIEMPFFRVYTKEGYIIHLLKSAIELRGT